MNKGMTAYINILMLISVLLVSCAKNARHAKYPIISRWPSDFKSDSLLVNYEVSGRLMRKSKKNKDVNSGISQVAVYCKRMTRDEDGELGRSLYTTGGWYLDSLLQPKYLVHKFECKNIDLINCIRYDFIGKIIRRKRKTIQHGNNPYAILIGSNSGCDTLVWVGRHNWFLNSTFMIEEKSDFVGNLEKLSNKYLLCP